MNTHMSVAQAIGYYSFEVIASLILIVVLGVVAILAGGALMDRWKRIFRPGPASREPSSIPAVHVNRNGRI